MKALRVSERIRATRNFSLPAGYDDQCEPHFIVRRDAAQLWDARTGRVPASEGGHYNAATTTRPLQRGHYNAATTTRPLQRGHYNAVTTTLSGLELGVALDEFFCAAAREADGEAAVVFITFDADDGTDSVFGVTNFAAEHGIGWCTARSRTAEAGSFRALTRCGRTLRGGATTNAANKFLGRVRILGVGFVAAGLADFCHGAAGGVHELAGNFREKTRRLRGAELLFVSKNAAVNGAGKRERLTGAGHTDVDEAAFFFDAFFFVDGAAVWADAFFHAGEEK